MKWLILLFSFIKPFFSSEHQSTNPVAEIKEMIRENAVKIVVLFAATMALATLFAGGLLLTAVDIGAQYDQNGFVYFSSMIIMGLSLSVISLVAGALIIRNFQDANTEKKRETLTPNSVGVVHPLQDALALLVMDFIKEREHNREKTSYSDRVKSSPPNESEREPYSSTEEMRH